MSKPVITAINGWEITGDPQWDQSFVSQYYVPLPSMYTPIYWSNSYIYTAVNIQMISISLQWFIIITIAISQNITMTKHFTQQLMHVIFVNSSISLFWYLHFQKAMIYREWSSCFKTLISHTATNFQISKFHISLPCVYTLNQLPTLFHLHNQRRSAKSINFATDGENTTQSPSWWPSQERFKLVIWIEILYSVHLPTTSTEDDIQYTALTRYIIWYTCN